MTQLWCFQRVPVDINAADKSALRLLCQNIVEACLPLAAVGALERVWHATYDGAKKMFRRMTLLSFAKPSSITLPLYLSMSRPCAPGAAGSRGGDTRGAIGSRGGGTEGAIGSRAGDIGSPIGFQGRYTREASSSSEKETQEAPSDFRGGYKECSRAHSGVDGIGRAGRTRASEAYHQRQSCAK